MKYKLSMLQQLRTHAWYKYQYYNPEDKYSDDFGFVHFSSKKSLDDYIKEMRREGIPEYKGLQ
jgi:hypothetical protein